MPDQLLDVIGDVLTLHSRRVTPDLELTCSCGRFTRPEWDNADSITEWDEHRAGAVYTAILASGRLLPEDADCIEMFGAFSEGPLPAPWMSAQHSRWLLRSTATSALRSARFFGPTGIAAKMKIYTYPDGTETRLPWVQIPDPGGNLPIDDTPVLP